MVFLEDLCYPAASPDLDVINGKQPKCVRDSEDQSAIHLQAEIVKAMNHYVLFMTQPSFLLILLLFGLVESWRRDPVVSIKPWL